MRKIKEVLRLHYEARLSERQIAKICALGKGTVRRFLKRAEAAGLSWVLPPSLDDAALEKKLLPPPPPPSAGQRPQPDYATVHKELRGPNDLGVHYGVGILPERPYHARDKDCASYYTLSRFDSGQNRLGGAAATSDGIAVNPNPRRGPRWKR